MNLGKDITLRQGFKMSQKIAFYSHLVREPGRL